MVQPVRARAGPPAIPGCVGLPCVLTLSRLERGQRCRWHNTAEGILIGTVAETPQSLEILARFVDVDTAVVLAVGDVYGEDLTPPTVKTLVEGLVWKLQRQFPLAEGVVLEKIGKQLFTDLNERHGVKRFMKLLIFRPGQEFKHPQTGHLLKKPDVILGEARITAVSPDLSEALVLPTEALGDVRESDMVITK